MHVLIMESDSQFNGELTEVIKKRGDKVTSCSDMTSGFASALAQPFELILIGLAGLIASDISKLKSIPKNYETPIMVFSVSNSLDNRIASFKHGADDYLLKPANLTEVLLRIDVVLRRYTKPSVNESSVISIDQLSLFKSTQSVVFAESELHITPIQFRLLWQLVQNRHQVLSKAFLYQVVLGRPFSTDDRSLDMHLSRIRKKLVAKGMSPERLTTVHGKGYRFS